MSPVVVKLRTRTWEESLALRVHAGYQPRKGWQRRSLCLGAGDETAVPKMCPTCPVRLDCLAAVMTVEAERSAVYVVGHMAISAKKRIRWMLPKPLTQNCGTQGGYAAHRRAGEEACVPCKEAKAQANKINKQNRRSN